MRNIWIVAKREYLERVRRRSFIIVTLLLPVLMAAIFIVPAKLSTSRGGTRNVAVVTSTPEFGERIKQRLEAGADQSRDPFRGGMSFTFKVLLSTDATDRGRSRLRDEVRAGKLDGFLWVTDDAIRERKVTYHGRDAGDPFERSSIRASVNRSLVEKRLAERGVNQADVDELMAGISLETVKVDGSGDNPTNNRVLFGTVFALVMLLYSTLLFYGSSVMRAVTEEKNSRVVEVLLSSATPHELMAGKIVGVGAVGLTQMLIWALMGAVVAGPAVGGMLAFSPGQSFRIAPAMLVAFAAAFLLGYTLYSSAYAGLGALVNSDQEGQQLHFIIAAPMILAVVLLMPVLRNPASPLAIVLSLFPFTSPVIMYVRVAMQQVPLWQVLLSLAIMLVTIYYVIWLSARIYRIGILMYGKRPTLPEILKWIRYAGA